MRYLINTLLTIVIAGLLVLILVWAISVYQLTT